MQAVIGIIAILGLGYLLCKDRSLIQWRFIAIGLVLQFALATLFLKVAWIAESLMVFNVIVTAIEQATKGLASVRVLRSSGETTTTPTRHDGKLWFLFVLEGSARFAVEGPTNAASLTIGDSVAVPAGVTWGLHDASPSLRLLEVVVP